MANIVIDTEVFKIECPVCKHKNSISSYTFSTLKLNKGVTLECNECKESLVITPKVLEIIK